MPSRLPPATLALLAALALPAAADPAATAPEAEALRAAYADGFWHGYALARTTLGPRTRATRSAFGLSEAGPSAPVWIVPADADPATATLTVPPSYATGPGTRAVYYKGPWIWLDADAADLVATGTFHPGHAAGQDDLAEATELDPPVLEAIRRMRAMGLNEGLVLVRALPVN
jgi:hypothetical protein